MDGSVEIPSFVKNLPCIFHYLYFFYKLFYLIADSTFNYCHINVLFYEIPLHIVGLTYGVYFTTDRIHGPCRLKKPLKRHHRGRRVESLSVFVWTLHRQWNDTEGEGRVPNRCDSGQNELYESLQTKGLIWDRLRFQYHLFYYTINNRVL